MHVKLIFDVAKTIGFPLTLQTLIPLLEPLTKDGEQVVRQHLVEQVRCMCMSVCTGCIAPFLHIHTHTHTLILVYINTYTCTHPITPHTLIHILYLAEAPLQISIHRGRGGRLSVSARQAAAPGCRLAGG
ncbi:hypothetical protein EON63_12555 [archaeon]|nr:MAG: hypothetical protein EON63_12555 [archaeon]